MQLLECWAVGAVGVVGLPVCVVYQWLELPDLSGYAGKALAQTGSRKRHNIAAVSTPLCKRTCHVASGDDSACSIVVEYLTVTEGRLVTQNNQDKPYALKYSASPLVNKETVWLLWLKLKWCIGIREYGNI